MPLSARSLVKYFTCSFGLLGLLATQAHAAAVISDDFEGDLSAWTGKNGGSHSGLLVQDPLDANNQVLSFGALTGAGDVFTIATAQSATGEYTVEFDYLGMPGMGGRDGDLGGYFGISADLPGNHYWVAGTGSYATPIALVDDGQWHHYSLTFNSPIGNDVHFMLEDWNGSGGVAGDIFFDNFVFGDSESVANVPEPSSMALFGIGALALLGFRKRKA